MSSSKNRNPLLEGCYKALQAEKDAQAHRREVEQARQRADKAVLHSEEEARLALIKYTQISCRALCDKMQATLPREIRDEVYQYLIPHWPIESQYGFGVSTGRPASGIVKLQHLLQEECMGPDCLREIQEECFRTSKFYFDRCHYVTSFCTADPLSSGLLACDICLDVKITFACEEYRFPNVWSTSSGMGGWGGNDGGDSGWDTKHCHTVEALTSLESLFGLRRGSRITLDITVVEDPMSWDFSDWQWLWKKVIPYIFPTLRKLSLSGRSLTVCLSGEPYKLEATDRNFSVEDWKDYVYMMQEKAAEVQRLREEAAVLEKLKKEEEERYLGIEDMFSSAED